MPPSICCHATLQQSNLGNTLLKEAYQTLARGANIPLQCSNVVKQVLKAEIPTPRLLILSQCLDRVEACTRRMKVIKGQAGSL
jgi:hypothetical protein